MKCNAPLQKLPRNKCTSTNIRHADICTRRSQTCSAVGPGFESCKRLFEMVRRNDGRTRRVRSSLGWACCAGEGVETDLECRARERDVKGLIPAHNERQNQILQNSKRNLRCDKRERVARPRAWTGARYP
eukprot:2445322-Rhodomonas_salina.2